MKDWGTDLIYETTNEKLSKVTVPPHKKYTKINLSTRMLSVSENKEGIKMKALLDNNPNTYWKTLTQDKKNKQAYKAQYLTIKISKPTTVSAIGAAWHTGYQRMYGHEVETSLDGKTYKQVARGMSHTDNSLQKIDFTPQKVRFIRLKCKGTMRGYSILNEITLYE